MKAGDIYTVAGSRSKNHYSGDGGLAVNAGLSGVTGAVRTDKAGNLVFADSNAARIRVVAVRTGTFYGQAMQAGHIYTVAGDGRHGFSGDGGVATRAGLDLPYGLTIDPAGNLVIADSGHNRVRVVAARTGTFYGRARTAGHIYTIAGDGTAGSAGDGGPPARAELDLGGSSALALDSAGNLLIAANGDGLVRVVAASTATFYGQAMKAGRIYTIAGTAPLFLGNGLPATSATLVPQAVTVNAAGGLLISEDADIRMVPAMPGTFYGQAMQAGHIYRIAGTGADGFSGDGGPAIKARMSGVEGLAVDTAGNLVISDSSNNRIRVVAAHTGAFYGKAMKAGDIYTVAGGGTSGLLGDGGPATQAALFLPFGSAAALDQAGNLLIADIGSDRIRLVSR